jgi:type I restriction enzyme, S subunit
MRIEKLGNIVIEIRTGKTPPTTNQEYFGEEVAWYTPTDLDREKYLENSKRGITELAVTEKKVIIYKPNTVLLGCIGDIGKIGITKVRASSNQQITGILPNDEIINSEYLYYWLKKNKVQLQNASTNAIIPMLNNKELSAIKISFPENIEDQKKIAAILGNVETLIKQRKESIDLLDVYLKSTFLKMFGDLVKNEKGYKKNKLGNYIVDLIAGSSYLGIDKGTLENDELGVLKSSSVTWGTFNPKEFKAVSKNLINKPIINPLKGDLLFSRANTRELVGATCIVLEDYPNLFLPDKIWKVVLDENIVTNYYIHYLLQDFRFKKSLTNSATGSHGSMLNISMDKLRNLVCPIPKIELQFQFNRIVEKIEFLKTDYQKSLQELENLFSSVSQKAFKGELDLSNVVLKTNEVVNIKIDTKTISKEVVKKKFTEEVKKEKLMLAQKSIWLMAKLINPSSIPFNQIEGMAVLEKVFSKQKVGFSFQEYEQFIKKEKFKYTYDELKEFFFGLLEEKKLVQFYASKKWVIEMRAMVKPTALAEDFSTEGSIWFLMNKTEQAS